MNENHKKKSKIAAEDQKVSDSKGQLFYEKKGLTNISYTEASSSCYIIYSI